jgi:hypothetical protein
MASLIGICTAALDKNIESLKKKGLLQRIGPAKGGNWKIIFPSLLRLPGMKIFFNNILNLNT